MKHNEVSGTIVDTALMIHRELGPGLLESVYQRILGHESQRRGLNVAQEVPIPIVWDGVPMELGFRADLIVEDMVIVELKSQEKVLPVHKKQLLTYLRVADKRLGLLLNFGEETMKKGIHRLVNGLVE